MNFRCGAPFFISLLLTASINASLNEDYAETQRLSSAIDYVKNLYIRDIPMKQITDHAIQGLLQELDPHSTYLNKEALDELNASTTGELIGIGIEVAEDKGRLKVITPLDDSPAKKAGIRPGDFVISVNNKLVEKSSIYDVIHFIRGPVGTKVKLIIQSALNHEQKTLELIREKINIHSVKYKTLMSDIGYIRISSFSENTAEDVKNALLTFRKHRPKIKGIVLDLRNNPGGLLSSAIDTSNLFLDSNKMGANKKIVYTKGRFTEDDLVAYANPKDVSDGTPLSILINEGSASASEIVAVALQEHNRGILVGRQTFGKGSVQSIFHINDESAIKLTTSLYYSPDGNSIQEHGVTPDIYVPFDEINDSVYTSASQMNEQSLNKHIINNNPTLTKKTFKDELRKVANSDFPLYQSIMLLEGINAFQN